jgi:hypothetical protein
MHALDGAGTPEDMMIYNHINYQTFNFNIGYKFDFNFPKINRASKEPKNTELKKRKKSEKELLIEQNELLKKQIELLKQKQ